MMHLPDGFLDTRTWVVLSVVSAGAMAVAVRKTKDTADERRIPLMGVTAAFVFAAQMVNFPVAAGTSGHFMGAALAAILLGVYPSFLIMATLLTVQCFLFQDGGVTALGANIFNMGIIAPAGGYAVYRTAGKVLPRAYRIAVPAALAGWASVVLSSAACAAELALSGSAPFRPLLPVLVGIHAVIGVVEGAVTALVLRFVEKVRPDLLKREVAGIP